MVSDVAVNSYAKYGLGFGGWYGDLSLQLQTLFLGLVIGAAPLIWLSERSAVAPRMATGLRLDASDLSEETR
jgi:hypothetical protein